MQADAAAGEQAALFLIECDEKNGMERPSVTNKPVASL